MKFHIYVKYLVTFYDLSHGYSDLPVHELSAFDRSEKVVYIKIYLQLIHHITVYPSSRPFSYYISKGFMVPSTGGVLCSVCGAFIGNL